MTRRISGLWAHVALEQYELGFINILGNEYASVQCGLLVG
jgi:hypothetical protein